MTATTALPAEARPLSPEARQRLDELTTVLARLAIKRLQARQAHGQQAPRQEG